MSKRRAKAIRKALKPVFAPFDLKVSNAVHITTAVPSRRYNVTTKDKDGKEQILENRAIQVTLYPESPRAVYQKAKTYVKQGIRPETSGGQE